MNSDNVIFTQQGGMNSGLNVLRIKYTEVKSVISDKAFCKGAKT